MKQPLRFHCKLLDVESRSLVCNWLKQPYILEWFYGEGLENTIKGMDAFLRSEPSLCQYWLAYDQEHPFAFLITSFVEKPGDDLAKWCLEEGEAITLDMLIGDPDYLGKGLAHIVIREFLLSQFSHKAEVLIDPEATNARAIHVYQKVGFKIVDTFIPSHSPNPHYMMRLSMKDLHIRKPVCRS